MRVDSALKAAAARFGSTNIFLYVTEDPAP